MLNKLTTLKKHTSEEGFTLLELMVVIVIIGILAAIAVPISANQQKAAIDADSKSNIRQLRMAIELARVKTSLPLISITLQSCTACRFTEDPLSLPQTDNGWVTYYRTLDRISTASGMDVRNLLDGYGRPIFIDENETEGGGCSKDALGSYVNPYDPTRLRENVVTIPQYTTACRS